MKNEYDVIVAGGGMGGVCAVEPVVAVQRIASSSRLLFPLDIISSAVFRLLFSSSYLRLNVAYPTLNTQFLVL